LSKFLDIKLDRQVSKILLEAKDKGHAIKLRHSKVVICGSSASGKTSFLNLLVRNDFEKEHKMTGLSKCEHKMIVRKMSVTKDDEGISFKNLELDQQIRMLRSCLNRQKGDVTDKGKSIRDSESGDIFFSNVTEDIPAQLPLHGNSALDKVAENITKSDDDDNSMSPLTAHVGQLSLSSEEPAEKVMSDSNSLNDDDVGHADIEQRLANVCNEEESEELPEIWDVLTFLDTGGQPEYISVLPAVNSAVMVTFVVLSLEHGLYSLSQKITVHGGDENHSYDLSYDYSTLVKMLISMRRPQTQSNFSEEQGDTDRSYLSFIGTKSDIISENLQNVVSSIDKGLQSIVKEAECETDLLLVSNYSWKCLIPVSNCHANTPNEDPNAALLRDAIYKRLEERNVYDIPIQWLLLELEIKQCCMSNDNKSYMTFDEVYTLCKKCSISDDEEYIRSFLKSYHILGIFLFYDVPRVENPIVIINHQWLFDNLSKLVDFAIKAKHDSLDQRLQLSLKKGLVSRKFMEEIKFDLTNDYFIKLLEHLKIIAPVSTGPEASYFIPCILPTYPLDNDDDKLNFLDEYGGSHSARPLLIQISNNSSADSYYGLPRGVFCCLVVYLLQLQNTDPTWYFLRMQYSNKEDNPCIYHNLVIFQYSPNDKCEHYIILIDRFIYLEIQIRSKEKPESNQIYIDIKGLMKSSVKKVCEELKIVTDNLCVAFACAKCKKRHLARKSFDADPLEPFHCQKTNMIVWYADSVWFSKVS